MNTDKKSRSLSLCQNILLSLVALLIINSCSGVRDKSTNLLIIPRDTMIHVISDIHIVDAVLINALNNRRIEVNTVPNYYVDILERYNISKERFDVSLRYYCDNLDEFDKMYDEIIEILSTKQAEYETKTEH
ncbi:MAG: DUF4296 domain-containing protein [Salinivirgaceae bacterium]|jgi:hypothetical protein|nr:DUF4296 domain-containing protein [Bacteroidales bacterium]